MAGGSKKFINNSGTNLTVTLFVQQGTTVTSTVETVTATVNAGASVQISYGADGASANNPYLNGLSFTWSSGGVSFTQTLQATTGNTSFGNSINTNNTVTIQAVSGPNLSFSNT